MGFWSDSSSVRGAARCLTRLISTRKESLQSSDLYDLAETKAQRRPPDGSPWLLTELYSFLLTENSGTSSVFSALFFLSDLAINIPWTRFVPRSHYSVLLVNMLRLTLVQWLCTSPFFTCSGALLTFSSRPCSLGKVSPFAHSLFASW